MRASKDAIRDDLGRWQVDSGRNALILCGASTRMACRPALDAPEHKLGEALAKAARGRVNAGTLELFDATGAPLVLLEAVYF